MITNISCWDATASVGAEFSHSTLPVMCNNCLAIFTCFANERVQSISLSAASDSGSGWLHLSNPFFHSQNSLVANQEDTFYMTWPDHKCHVWPSVVCSCSHSVEYVNGPHLLNVKIQEWKSSYNRVYVRFIKHLYLASSSVQMIGFCLTWRLKTIIIQRTNM